MRQRYHISKEGTTDDLVIREYAVLGKEKKQSMDALPFEDEYVLLYREDYSGDAVKRSISRGQADLIATLRTAYLFPAGRMAVEIAQAVMELYLSVEDHSVELSFDDIEEFAHT